MEQAILSGPPDANTLEPPASPAADSPEAQRAAGYVLGWHNAQAAHAWKDAHKGWQKLDALPRFWG